MMSRCASGCVEIGVLVFEFQSVHGRVFVLGELVDSQRFVSTTIAHFIRRGVIRDREETNRIDGTECASCCGAFRSWKFPWLISRG